MVQPVRSTPIEMAMAAPAETQGLIMIDHTAPSKAAGCAFSSEVNRAARSSAGNQVDLGEAMVASALELRHESFHLCTPSRVEVKLTLQDR